VVAVVDKRRVVERDERGRAWVIDGERYLAAVICGRVHMLPIGRALVIEDDPHDGATHVVIDRARRSA
jgi:hypothetical protein